MKRNAVFAAAAALLLALCPLQGAEGKEKAPAENEYEFFSLTVCPGISTAPDAVDVYGVRIGAPIGFGDDSFVAGIELSILAGMSSGIYGLQAAPMFVSADRVEGIQFSVVNIVRTIYGLQLGVVNVARDTAFQIGLINYIRESPLPVFPFVNVRF